jgi:hypothetical protein
METGGTRQLGRPGATGRGGTWQDKSEVTAVECRAPGRTRHCLDRVLGGWNRLELLRLCFSTYLYENRLYGNLSNQYECTIRQVIVNREIYHLSSLIA